MVRMTQSISWMGRFARRVARIFPTSLLLGAIVLVISSNVGFAQLSGSYTIGSGQTYTSLAAFATALNSQGVSGPVTATVAPGTYTGTVVFNSITGASSTNTITIQGQNVNTCIIENSTTGSNTYVIRLNGTDYLRLRDLTVNAIGTTYGYGIWLQNQANYNEITGCKVNVSTTSTSGYCVGILASGSSYSTSANSANYNLVQGNEVTGGYYGMRWNGTSSTTNCVSNEFIENTVRDYYYAGLSLYYQGSMLVEGNTIVDRKSYSSSYGIYAYYCRTGAEITRNYIHVNMYGMYCYRINQDNTVRGNITNNMIICSGTSTNYGLRIYYYPYSMNVDNNSINLLTNSTGYGLYFYYGSSNYARNNIVQYKGTGTHYFVYLYSSYTVVPTMDYNLFWSPNSVDDTWRYNGYDYSLNDFKNAVTTQNNNSWVYDPEFISDYDLHTYSQNINGSGTPLGTVTTDFDGDVRSTTSPDLGADEYTLYATDIGARTLIAPVEGCGLTGMENLTVGVRNYGTSTLDASSNPITIQVTVTGPYPQNFSTVISSGTIAPGATVGFQVTSNLDLSMPGAYTFNATASAVGDGNAMNNGSGDIEFYVDKTVTSYPYSENFEADNGAFRNVVVGGSADDWQWGIPTYTGTGSITSANSGSNVWMTNLGSAYSNSANCALMTPCLDFTTLSAPVLQFYMNFYSETSYDGLILEASSNGGGSWTKITPLYPSYNVTSAYGPLPTPYYGGSSNTWKKYVFLLSSYAAQSSVKVRWRFQSDGSVTYNGFAVDDVALGDFLEKDVTVTDVVYDNATGYWARRQGASHVIHARLVNLGYEQNPSSVTITYKEGSVPTSSMDGVSETFTPSWSGSEAWVTFTTQHIPAMAGATDIYVKAFYTGDLNTSNDAAMTTPMIQPESVYGYEDFNTLTPPSFETGWTVLNVNNDETWETSAGNGTSGSVAASYPGDLVAANDWLFTPGAYLEAGSSYSFDLKYRSRNGDAQTIELAFGSSPNPNAMTVFATYSNFTNTAFATAMNQYGVSPTFDTPNQAQTYYVGIHLVSSGSSGPVDLDDMKLYDNPYPPPKIAYGIDPIYIDDPTIPMSFTGVYKKTGLLTRTYEVVNSTGWYGDPEGDMLWDVNTTASWIDLFKSTPDPLTYLTTNPFTPPWCRQHQTFTMEVNASILPPGTHSATLDFDAYLYNSVYTRGIRASNAIFSVPVELTLSSAGGTGTGVVSEDMTHSGLTPSGSPYIFMDGQGNIFAIVQVLNGTIPTMTITSYPGQLPSHISKYKYVNHYWTIDADGSGWNANVEFHYFDSEAQAGGVINEDWLRGMRIAPGTGFWEDPIAGTNSTPVGFYNYVMVSNINPKNYAGEIALAHSWEGEEDNPEKISAAPASYTLDQNFPNPFNPSTTIRFGLPDETQVSLVVINAMGEEVARLVDRTMPAGYHNVSFDAEDLPSGMYIYRLTAGGATQTRTMILNK